MKKTYAIINVLLFAITAILCVYYDLEGGLLLKGITASGFVALGLVNLIYAVQNKIKSSYPFWMAAGLIVCMVGDLVLNVNFIPGAVVFALGHILYCVAYCTLEKPEKTDIFCIAGTFILSVLILKLMPGIDFGGALMEGVCIGYAFVISCMVGKTAGNFLRRKNTVNTLLLIGSCLFYFSDLMLVVCWFANGPKITDTLCLFSYFPGQCLLAHSVFHFVNREKR